MTKTLPLIFVLSLGACMVQAQSLRSRINTVDRTVARMMKAKDSDGFTAYIKAGVTDDFQYVEHGQKQDVDQMCSSMKTGTAMIQRMSVCEAHCLSLHQSRDKAVAMTFHQMRGTVIGADKKSHHMSFSGTSRDTYVKQDGKWKMSKMEWTKETTLMDGKPMKGM